MASFDANEIIIVDSHYRDASTSIGSHSFQYQITLKRTDYTHVALIQASIPKTWYNFTGTNTSFVLRENGVNRNITIPDGNYTNQQFIDAILQQMNTGVGNLGWIYTMSSAVPVGQGDKGHFFFAVSGNGGLQPEFLFSQGDEEGIFIALGFNYSDYVWVNDAIESPNVIQLQKVPVIYIKSNLSYDNGGTLSYFLSENVVPFSYLSYSQENLLTHAVELRPYNSTTSRWEFSIVDNHDRLVNLNYIEPVFSLAFFKLNKLPQIHAAHLKIKNLEKLNAEE